jgi:hypothetical protein
MMGFRSNWRTGCNVAAADLMVMGIVCVLIGLGSASDDVVHHCDSFRYFCFE